MRNACRFLDLPDELQQEIYDRCDVYSRLRLDHVLKNKFTHKAAINKTLILIAYALECFAFLCWDTYFTTIYSNKSKIRRV